LDLRAFRERLPQKYSHPSALSVIDYLKQPWSSILFKLNCVP
jgi:hypothetical protein